MHCALPVHSVLYIFRGFPPPPHRQHAQRTKGSARIYMSLAISSAYNRTNRKCVFHTRTQSDWPCRCTRSMIFGTWPIDNRFRVSSQPPPYRINVMSPLCIYIESNLYPHCKIANNKKNTHFNFIWKIQKFLP